MKVSFFCLFIFILLITSCSTIDIAKRKYKDGYYVSLLQKSKKVKGETNIIQKDYSSVPSSKIAEEYNKQEHSEQANVESPILKKENLYTEAGKCISGNRNKKNPDTISIQMAQKKPLETILKNIFPDQNKLESPTNTSRVNPMGIISIACGILSIPLFALPFFPYIFGILAIIFGAISLIRAKKNPTDSGYTVMPIIGIVSGSIGIIAAIVFWILVGSLILKGIQ